MTDCTLADEIDSLCVDFEQPTRRNIDFIASRLLNLVAAGHGLADIEAALRRCEAPIFLVGLPWVPREPGGTSLFLPGEPSVDMDLKYSLWIGINGRSEVNQVLAEASLSPELNLQNLRVTGFLEAESSGTDLPSTPTREELLKWLLLDAPTWTARRAVIAEHRQILVTDEALTTLDQLVEHPDLPPSARGIIDALRELLVRSSQDGDRVARQTCRFLVMEALYAFLQASTWANTAEVWQSYEVELSGDLAIDVLREIGASLEYTAAQRAVVENHTQVLEWAWEHGIEKAIEHGAKSYPTKYGAPNAQDYLKAYLRTPDLEAARDMLRTAPAGLLQLDRDALMAELRHADSEHALWRIGLLEDVRERGIDDAFRDWADLRAIENLSDDDRAIQLLNSSLERHRGALRDMTLELLLTRYGHRGDQDAQEVIARTLVDHRSDASPPDRRPLDLVNLGILSSQRGDLETARAAFREARSAFHLLRSSAARAGHWLKIGFFSRDYDRDSATALHCFRAAADDCEAADDLLSAAYAFEQLSSLYRMLARIDLAEVYATFADRLLSDPRCAQHGVTGTREEVKRSVEFGIGAIEFSLGDHASAAKRLRLLLRDSFYRTNSNERVAVERVILACAVERGDRRSARKIMTSWSNSGRHDWASLGRAALLLQQSKEDADRPFDPAASVELVGLAEALAALGASQSGIEAMFQPTTPSALARALIDTLAGAKRPGPLAPSRLFGDHEAAAWVVRSERTAELAKGTTAFARNPPTALPSGAPWSAVIARYDDLGVWELPDLVVLGPVLDRWSSLSRFDGPVRINPVAPHAGRLNVFFYRSDPEGHLNGNLHGCAYIPENDSIICSLPYLDDLFRVGRVQWNTEFERIKKGLIEANWPDAENAALSATNAIRSRERVLLEWIVAHEIGHAHFGHSGPSAGDALALEEQADAFFIDGIVASSGVQEVLQSLYGQLNLLYQYDCERQLGRMLTADESRDRSVLLDAAPDPTGHRPLVFRAVSLIKSILRIRPELEDTSYIEQFAASLEPRRSAI